LDRVIFKIVPDKTNLLMQLKSGEIDMVGNIPASEIESLKNSNNGLTVYQVDGRVYYYIGYNEKNSLFADREIRRALTMALDRNKIIDALLYGNGRPCLGPLAPMVKWAYNENVKDIAYNPETTKAVLKKAGWKDSDGDEILDKNGKKFEFTLSCATGNQLKADVAVIVQEQLKKIGIKVNIDMLEWTTFIDHIQSKNFDACINGWSTPYYVDPTPVFHSGSTDLFNFISYSNPKVDELIEKGRIEMDQQKAAGIWKEFHKIIYEDQPYTFLFWIDQAVAVKDKYKNVNPLALSSVYDLENWYIGSDN
jgi:peptide/nickel transport system substrate-binding protein